MKINFGLGNFLIIPVNNNLKPDEIDFQNIYSLIEILNIYKSFPAVIESLVIRQEIFFVNSFNNTLVDCLTIENLFTSHNLKLSFNKMDTIEIESDQFLSGNINFNRNNLINSVFKSKFSKLKLNNKMYNYFPLETSVRTLIEDGLKSGNNFFILNDVVQKSRLINDIIIHGKSFLV